MSPATDFLGSRYRVSGFPELVAEWDSDRNGTLTPDTVSAGSGRMIWWRCRRGEDHVWRAKPNNRTRGTGCPFCANKRVSRTNNLAACFPHVAAEWHPWRNGRVTAVDVLAGSSRIGWWRCWAHETHEWRASVRDRTRGLTTCPYCTHRRASAECSLADAHPNLAAEWHPSNNAPLTPRDVTPGSARIVSWQCLAHEEHTWSTSVANRVLHASGCPRCVRRGRTVTANRQESRPS